MCYQDLLISNFNLYLILLIIKSNMIKTKTFLVYSGFLPKYNNFIIIKQFFFFKNNYKSNIQSVIIYIWAYNR